MNEDLKNIILYQDTKKEKYINFLINKYNNLVWGYVNRIYKKYKNLSLSPNDIYQDHIIIFIQVINRVDRNKIKKNVNFNFIFCVYQDFKAYSKILEKRYISYNYVSIYFDLEGLESDMKKGVYYDICDKRYNVDNNFLKDDLYNFLNNLFEIDRQVFELILQGYNLLNISKELNQKYYKIKKIKTKLISYLKTYMLNLGYTIEDLQRNYFCDAFF